MAMLPIVDEISKPGYPFKGGTVRIRLEKGVSLQAKQTAKNVRIPQT
jgi:hypothetical protein